MRLMDVLTLLRRQCARAGGVSAYARANGLSVQYVSQVLHEHRPPSARLCQALGIREDGMRWVRDLET